MPRASVDREEANRQAMQRLGAAEPALVDLGRAGDLVPEMAPDKILTAGLVLPWEQYTGLQRSRMLQAAVSERLAADPDEAERKFADGAIRIGSASQHGFIGPGMAVCAASTQVLAVENRADGNRAFAPLTGPDAPSATAGEGDAASVDEVIVPVVREALQRAGGVALQPIIAGAMRLGDELYLRAGGAATLFRTNLFPALLEVSAEREQEVRAVLGFLERNGSAWFVRLALAAGKVMADAAHGVAGSSLLTGVVQSCRQLAIRVSGLGEEWFAGPLPTPDGAPFEVPGGDATLADSIALGDPRPQPRGDLDPAALLYWGFRSGVDLFKVLGTGVLPPLTGYCLDGQAALTGSIVARVPLACFETASAAYRRAYRKQSRD